MEPGKDTYKDLIERYFDGELDLREQQKFRDFLQDPKFQRAVKEHKVLLDGIAKAGEDFDQGILAGVDIEVDDPVLKEQLQQQEKKVQGKHPSMDNDTVEIVSSGRSSRRFMAVAATVLILIVAGAFWFANANYSGTSIAANQYEMPFPNAEMGVVDADSDFKKGRTAFFNEQYEASIPLLEAVPLQSDKYAESRYLLGHAHFNQKSYETAAGLFDKVLDDLEALPMIYRDVNQINWYLLLSKVGAGHEEAEIQALLKVLKESPAYKPKAEALEKALDSGWQKLVF